LSFLHYDLRDLLPSQYAQRRDHGEPHSLRPLLHHVVDGERRLVVPDDGDNSERSPAHCDRLVGDDA
jgi:hypothetical protein